MLKIFGKKDKKDKSKDQAGGDKHKEEDSGSDTEASVSNQLEKTSIKEDKSSDSTIPTLNVPENAERPLDRGGMLLVRLVSASCKAGETVDKGETVQVYCVIECDQNEIMVDSTNHDPRNPTWKNRSHFDVSRADGDISFSIWCRNTKTNDETFLGMLRQPIPHDREDLVDLKATLTGDGEEACGTLHVQIAYNKPEKNKKIGVDDFDLLTVIGKGSFGKVMQVRKKDTNRIYAMKIIRKAHIVERDEIEHTVAERNVLAKIKHPFIVNLKFSFQSPEKLYLVLAFVNGGELFKHLQDEGQFEESRAKVYTAQLLLALEHLHKFDIVYRDLKPENILLDYSGNIALCDFGLCKLQMGNGKKTNTFCGTPEYLAPELLIGEGYDKTVDWWTLGVLLYEMLTGLPPFYSENTNEMYRRILHEELSFPPEVSPLARNLLVKLLEKKPDNRLGKGGPQEIKDDPFFKDINWTKLMRKEITPLFKPHVKSSVDTSNFDEEFTSQAAVDSVVEDSQLTQSIQDQFQGFTYVDTNKMTYAQTPQMSSLRPGGF